MNSADFFVSLVAGLAVSLAVASAARSLLGAHWPRQSSPFGFDRGWIALALAVFAGPGILVDRLIDSAREGSLVAQDLGLGIGIALAWATLYGFVLLGCVTAVYGGQ